MSPGSFFYRFRSYTPYPIVLFFALWAEPTVTSFSAGVFLILIGEGGRLWGVAFIGSESRSRELSAGRLVSGGPYAYCRNPLYVANMVIYAGVTIAANIWLLWILPGVLIYFWIQYYYIVKAEEDYLLPRFGDDYRSYAIAVPRFFFRLTPWPGSERLPADWRAAFVSEKSSFLSMAAILVILLVRMVV